MTNPRSFRLRRLGAMLSFSSACSVACMDVAGERAAKDETVGFGESSVASVEVEDGLAVVRRFDDERLELWQSAPSIEVVFEVREAVRIDLDVKNTMPDATLTQRSGPEIAIEQHSREHPTHGVFSLTLPEPGTFRLRLAEPNAELTEPFTIALMSDVQEAIADVGDIYERINQEPDVDFLLGAGDLTEDGSRSELSRFEDALSTLLVPYYTTLGNHELGVRPPPFQDTYGRASFSFVHRGARFTLLDSASATIDDTVYEWLDAWLVLGQDQFHAVAMHIPPIDPVGVRNGSFASRNEANKLLAMFLSRRVDLTLYGHLHSYFSFENAGIAARISGGGGAIPERFDRIGRHFLTIDVDPSNQRFATRVVRIDGDFR